MTHAVAQETCASFSRQNFVQVLLQETCTSSIADNNDVKTMRAKKHSRPITLLNFTNVHSSFLCEIELRFRQARSALEWSSQIFDWVTWPKNLNHLCITRTTSGVCLVLSLNMLVRHMIIHHRTRHAENCRKIGWFNKYRNFERVVECLVHLTDHDAVAFADHRRQSQHLRQPRVHHQLPQVAPVSPHPAQLSLHQFPVTIRQSVAAHQLSITQQQTRPSVPLAPMMLCLPLPPHWTMAQWCVRRPTDTANVHLVHVNFWTRYC